MGFEPRVSCCKLDHRRCSFARRMLVYHRFCDGSRLKNFRLPLKGDTRRHSCGRGSPSGWLFAQTRRMDACVRWHDVENAGATFNMELDRSYLRPTLTIAYTTDNAHALHSTCISNTATSYAKSCSNRVCSSNWRSDSMYTFQLDPVRSSSC